MKAAGFLLLLPLLISLATVLVSSRPAPVSLAAEQKTGTISLAKGWNLISIPISLTDAAPAAVFASVSDKLAAAWGYQNNAWLGFFPGAPAEVNSLTAVDEKMGLWVEMKDAATLTVQGMSLAATQIPISEGWNLIGFPTLESQPVEAALAAIEGSYSAVWGYRRGGWVAHFPGAPADVNTMKKMTPTEGYWIQATAATILTVR